MRCTRSTPNPPPPPNDEEAGATVWKSDVAA